MLQTIALIATLLGGLMLFPAAADFLAGNPDWQVFGVSALAILFTGGILYSALDDVMANWLFLKGSRAHTARCEVRYRQPLKTGTTVLLEGRLIRRKGKVAFMQGRALMASDLSVVAEADASFMIVGEE